MTKKELSPHEKRLKDAGVSGDDTPDHLETYQDSHQRWRWKMVDAQGLAIDSSDDSWESKAKAEKAGRDATGLKVKRS